MQRGRGMTSAPRPSHFMWLAIAILLASFALRVWDLGGASLWADEVMTEFRAQAPFMQAYDSILKTIDQVPFYFMVLRLMPTDNELLLRLPSALLGVLGTALVMFVTVRVYGNYSMALWAGIWLTFNPFHIWLSRMARAYSLVFILSLLVSYWFLALWNGRNTRRAWFAFTLSSLIAYLTHYSLLALPFTQAILLAANFRSKRSLFRRWILTQGIALSPMLVWLVLMLLNYTAREPQWGAPPRMNDLLLSLWSLTAGYSGSLTWYVVPGLIVAALGIILYLRTERVRTRDVYWFLLVALPMILVFSVSAWSPMNMYIDRYFMALLPAVTFVIAYGWSYLPRKVAIPAVAAIIITGTLSVTATVGDQGHQREDWRSAAAFVSDRYLPGDVFVVDRDVTLKSFERYFGEREGLQVLQLVEVDEAPTEQPVAQRYWVIYRNPAEDIHQVGVLPTFDPLVPNETSAVSRWLQLRLDRVTEYQVFDGVSVLLVDMTAGGASTVHHRTTEDPYP
jgi:hypothetical protein